MTNRSVNAKLAAIQELNEFLIETGHQTELDLSIRGYLKIQIAYANPSIVSKEQVEAFRQQILVELGLAATTVSPINTTRILSPLPCCTVISRAAKSISPTRRFKASLILRPAQANTVTIA